MPKGRRRAAAVGAVMDALMRGPTLPLPMSAAAIESLFAVRRYAARMRQRRIRVRGFDLPYLEGGSGPPLVLLHGFGDNKDSFVDAARSLTAHRRVILPDLLGFGEASQPLDFSYRLSSMAEVLADFVDALGLTRYDLGGNSLGGGIAAHLALERPHAVRTLTLIAASGVDMPVPSTLQRRLEAGDNPFVVDSFEGYRAFMQLVLEKPPSVPPAVQRYLATTFISRAPIHAKIMDDLVGAKEDLTPRLGSLTVPTLVLWGDRDRLIDISAGHVFHRHIEGARFVVMPGIGHCPQYESPHQTARTMREFLRGFDRGGR